MAAWRALEQYHKELQEWEEAWDAADKIEQARNQVAGEDRSSSFRAGGWGGGNRPLVIHVQGFQVSALWSFVPQVSCLPLNTAFAFPRFAFQPQVLFDLQSVAGLEASMASVIC